MGLKESTSSEGKIMFRKTLTYVNLGRAISLILIALFVVGMSMDAQAQNRRKKNFYHQRKQNEWSIGVGAANFLGDLGGLDKLGSEFVWDLEFQTTKPAVQVSYMNFLTHRAGLRYKLSWCQVAGDDKLTNEFFRNNRNLHFKSHIWELSVRYEYHFIKEKIGHKFDLRDQRMRLIGLRGRTTGLYAFGGVGAFHFNPKAQVDGKWIALQPLNTEGQGLDDGPSEYRRVSVSFPVGGGLRFARSNRLVFSLELGYHFTLTDYIDDVSGTYYDGTALSQINGPLAAELGDPSLGLEGYPLAAGEITAGQQRGDPTDKDGFFQAFFSMNYKLRPSRASRKRTMYRAKINKRVRF